jgi:hypothetical protein
MPCRLTTAVSAIAACMAVAAPALAADPDGDGLPTKWEQGKSKSVVNLKKLGAKPKVKDVFIEIDYSDGTGPSDIPCDELDDFTDAMAGGAVQNPGGTEGVRLHIDAGRSCPGPTDYDFGGSQHVNINEPCLNPGHLSQAPFKGKRFKAFHHALITDPGEICGGAAGVATDVDFLVDVNGGGGFGHVAMHELGHTFGLDHGSITSFSVMSGLIHEEQAPYERILDYNRYPIDALDEDDLSEPDGLQSTPSGETFLAGVLVRYYCPNGMNPPQLVQPTGGAAADVDWDCDSYPYLFPPPYTIDAGSVSGDINGNGLVGDTIAAQVNDWEILVFDNGRIGG